MHKITKAILFVTVLAILLFGGGFGLWQLSESDSVSVQWQKILPWCSGVCFVAFAVGIFWFNSARKKW